MQSSLDYACHDIDNASWGFKQVKMYRILLKKWIKYSGISIKLELIKQLPLCLDFQNYILSLVKYG